jgi:hypothetical protein
MVPLSSWFGQHWRAPIQRRDILKLAGSVPFVAGEADGRSPDVSDPIFFGAADATRILSYSETVLGRTADVAALGPLQPALDGAREHVLPFVTSQGALRLIGADGVRRTAVDGTGSVQAATQRTRLTVGEWNRKRSVFFVGDGHDAIYRATVADGPTLVASPAAGAQAVAGIADIDRDGVAELLFVGRDRGLRALAPDGTTDDLGSAAAGVGRGIGVGAPVRAGTRGRALVPIVDSEGDILLVGANGPVRRVTTDGSVAAMAPLAATDLDRDGQPELVFVAADGDIGYVDDLTGDQSVGRLFDSSVSVNRGAGIVGTRAPLPARTRTPESSPTLVTDGEAEVEDPAVAVDGRTALVGGLRDEGGTDHVSVFLRGAQGWSRQGSLRAPDDAAEFGHAVALDGAVAVVGAPLARSGESDFAGAAYVFTRAEDAWALESELAPGDPTGVDRFGTAVAVDGDTALVGASTDTNGRGARVGSASVFIRSAEGWIEEAKLLPDADTEAFGRALALDGDTAVVGARRSQDGAPDDAGMIYVFSRSDEEWSRDARLEPDGTNRDDRFGTAVALDGDTVLVGAPAEATRSGDASGAVHVFGRANGAWAREAHLAPGRTREGGRLGSTVALDEDVAVVARHSSRVAGPTANPGGGSVQLLRRSEGTWRRTRRLDIAGRDSSLALQNGTAVVSSWTDLPPNGRPSGSIEVFEP